MMVPKPTLEQGLAIDCYLDSRPKVTTGSSDSPAIVDQGDKKHGS